DVDAEPGELLAGFAGPFSPLHATEAAGRLGAEKHGLGHRQVWPATQLLMHHGDAGRQCVALRYEMLAYPIHHASTGQLRVHAGDDVHEHALGRRGLADETMDLAGEKLEVDPKERLYAAEGFCDALEHEDELAAVRHRDVRSGSDPPSTASPAHSPW